MGAYKQFLASDIIVTPFEVNKDFTFYSSNSSSLTSIDNSTVNISRYLGQNLTLFPFNPNIDPITGNDYTIITPGTTSSFSSFSIVPFYNQAGTIGSSSFYINGVTINLTGSSAVLQPNTSTTINIKRTGTQTVTAALVVANINNSSSNYTPLNDISASNATTNISLYSKSTGYIKNYYTFTSASATSYFSGGSNDVVSGSIIYQRLVYNSIKQLYYSNYLISESGDPISQPYIYPGANEEGNRITGSSNHNPFYDNYLQTDLSYNRFIPQVNNSYIGVLSIPNYIFGDYIQPGSFRMQYASHSFYDDGEGNLLTGSAIIGNIVYPHGIVTLTGNSAIYAALAAAAGSGVQEAIYGLFSTLYGTTIQPYDVYGTTGGNWIDTISDFVTATDFT